MDRENKEIYRALSSNDSDDTDEEVLSNRCHWPRLVMDPRDQSIEIIDLSEDTLMEFPTPINQPSTSVPITEPIIEPTIGPTINQGHAGLQLPEKFWTTIPIPENEGGASTSGQVSPILIPAPLEFETGWSVNDFCDKTENLIGSGLICPENSPEEGTNLGSVGPVVVAMVKKQNVDFLQSALVDNKAETQQKDFYCEELTCGRYSCAYNLRFLKETKPKPKPPTLHSAKRRNCEEQGLTREAILFRSSNAAKRRHDIIQEKGAFSSIGKKKCNETANNKFARETPEDNDSPSYANSIHTINEADYELAEKEDQSRKDFMEQLVKEAKAELFVINRNIKNKETSESYDCGLIITDTRPIIQQTIRRERKANKCDSISPMPTIVDTPENTEYLWEAYSGHPKSVKEFPVPEEIIQLSTHENEDLANSDAAKCQASTSGTANAGNATDGLDAAIAAECQASTSGTANAGNATDGLDAAIAAECQASTSGTANADNATYGLDAAIAAECQASTSGTANAGNATDGLDAVIAAECQASTSGTANAGNATDGLDAAIAAECQASTSGTANAGNATDGLDAAIAAECQASTSGTANAGNATDGLDAAIAAECQASTSGTANAGNATDGLDAAIAAECQAPTSGTANAGNATDGLDAAIASECQAPTSSTANAGNATDGLDAAIADEGHASTSGTTKAANANDGFDAANAGTADADTADADTADAGTADAGTADVGTADAGTADAGTADAGTATGENATCSHVFGTIPANVNAEEATRGLLDRESIYFGEFSPYSRAGYFLAGTSDYEALSIPVVNHVNIQRPPTPGYRPSVAGYYLFGHDESSDDDEITAAMGNTGESDDEVDVITNGGGGDNCMSDQQNIAKPYARRQNLDHWRFSFSSEETLDSSSYDLSNLSIKSCPF